MAVTRQISMVLDLNKCIGCHTCSSACKLMRTNPKRPRVHVLE